MFIAVTKLEGLSHPLVKSVHLRRDYCGNTLIIGATEGYNPAKLYLAIGSLLRQAKKNKIQVDVIDIRISSAPPPERAAA